ncbi:MAG: hypothetical protein ABSG13_16600 [Bryobacteraceae bacterium]|jgi:hypothetical protein
MESGQLVLIGRCSKIFLKINDFLFVIRDYLIRNRRQVGVPIIQESSFPVHQPYALSVEKDIVPFEYVVVTRHHLHIVMRVNCGHFRIPGEELLAFGFGEYVRSLKLLEVSVRGGAFVEQERACCVERSSAKRR